MSREALDYFGENLMRYVRDAAIFDWDQQMRGEAKGRTAKILAEKLVGVSDQELELIRWLIPHVVDWTLDHMLWWLEREDSVDVLVSVGSPSPTNVARESDGLSGELYTDRGWIRRFSEQRYEEP